MPVASAAAVAIASSASVNASIARKNSCKAIINDFNSDTATIEQSQTYAECVNYLYPKSLELSEVDIIGLKISFLCSLIVGVVFFIKTNDSFTEKFFHFLFGVTIMPIVIAIFYFIFLGLKWVIS